MPVTAPTTHIFSISENKAKFTVLLAFICFCLVACGDKKSQAPAVLPITFKTTDLGLYVGVTYAGAQFNHVDYIGQLYTSGTSGGIYVTRLPKANDVRPDAANTNFDRCSVVLAYQGEVLYSPIGTLTCGTDVMSVYVVAIYP